ncbi:MAG: protein kinase [Verrucomicrobiota bacterium]
MNSVTKRICLDCGAELADDSLASSCTRCLLEACFEGHSVYGAPELAELRPQHLAVPGEVFGDYELIEEIARGGMGVVFKARQRSLDRVVAVKMLLPGWLNSGETVRRFRIEAEAASRLRHPRIVSIHEVGECEGQHFYSMDYIDGVDLVRRVERQPISPELAARWVHDVAEAIHHAHQHGILHRDLKPANVLIDLHDTPHVTDFGLAKLLDDVRDLTATGRVLGTPSFMPPEQADPARGNVTVASDVYGLGAILYYLLTGHAPFKGGTIEQTLRLLLTSEPIPPSRQREGIPRDLEIICLKCLTKEPPRRYASAAELAADLAAWRRREPIRARPVPLLERLLFWTRRNPKLAAVSFGLVGAVCVGSIAQQFTLRKWRAATAQSESLIQYMVQDLTEQLRPLGRLQLLDNVNRRVQQYYLGIPMKSKVSDPLAGKAQFFRNDASVLRELGRLNEAEASARSAISLLQPEARKQPAQAAWAVALGEAHAEMRNILAPSDGPTATTHAREAVLHLSRASKLEPDNDQTRAKLANAHLELGSVLREQHRPGEAALEVQVAADLLNQLPADGELGRARQLQLALVCYYRGLVCMDQQDRKKARDQFAEYLQRTEQLAGDRSGPADAQAQFNLAMAHSYVGQAHWTMSEYAGSLDHFRAYYKLAEYLQKLDPGNVNFRREYGSSLTWLATAYEKSGESREEIAGLLERAYDCFRKLAVDFPDGDIWQQPAADALIRLAHWHAQNNNLKLTWGLLGEELNHRWELLVDHPTQSGSHRRFLSVLNWTGDDGGYLNPAGPDYMTSLRSWLGKVAAQSADPKMAPHWRQTTATLHRRLAICLGQRNEFDLARRELELALPIWKQLTEERPDDLASASQLVETFRDLSLASLRSGPAAQLAQSLHPFLDWVKTSRSAGAVQGVVLEAMAKLRDRMGAAEPPVPAELMTELNDAADAFESRRSAQASAEP